MRLEPKVVVQRNVVNQSSRYGSAIKLIVLHSTEGPNRPGISDLAGLAAFFDNPSIDASAHVGTDADGHSARMVADERKSWTQAFFNPWSLSIEQIGYASGQWGDDQVLETARWIAHWSRKHNVPISEAKVIGTRIIHPGVIRHSQLGSVGGAHADPGPNFPFGACLHEAKHIKQKLQERDRERG